MAVSRLERLGVVGKGTIAIPSSVRLSRVARSAWLCLIASISSPEVLRHSSESSHAAPFGVLRQVSVSRDGTVKTLTVRSIERNEQRPEVPEDSSTYRRAYARLHLNPLEPFSSPRHGRCAHRTAVAQPAGHSPALAAARDRGRLQAIGPGPGSAPPPLAVLTDYSK